MKKSRTRWKRVKVPICGQRFFDAGNYCLGFFTVLRAYKCEEYCKFALTPDHSHWFQKRMLVIKTDTGLKYKVPFFPWADVTTADGKDTMSELFNKHPW